MSEIDQLHSCLSAVHIYDFHIFIFMLFTSIGYMTNSQLTIYLCGLIAEWIEHCTGIARSWVRVPLKPEFFFRLLFQLLKLKAHCEDHNFTHEKKLSCFTLKKQIYYLLS